MSDTSVSQNSLSLETKKAEMKRIPGLEMVFRKGMISDHLKARSVSKICEIFEGDYESEDFYKIMKTTLNSAQKIQKLRIDWGYCDSLHDTRFLWISNILKRLICLHTVEFDFRRCENVTDEGLKNLSHGLKELTTIKAISINFERCNSVTNEGMRSLSECLKQFSSLNIIDLDFSENKEITDQCLENLAKSLKRLCSLKSITLKFNGCTKITEKGIEMISEELKRSSTLWRLNLHFERCDTTDEVLKIPLSRQHLSLSFSDMKITDEGINHFSESLMQMTTLKTINLKFASCYNITHLVMKKMNTSLKSLFALEILKLDFSQTDISNQGLKEVSDGLELLTSLKVLDINFDE